MHTRRRALVFGAPAALLLAACATNPMLDERAPIVFVHGNGDSAALWQTTLWRFESNGWPRARLFAADQPFPLARDDDTRAQPGRSSTAESAAFLKAEVERVRQATGAAKVILIGNSRGGNTIRNYVQNLGGAAVVSKVVLGGVPSHGIFNLPGFNEGSEFSARSAFLRQLNAPKGPNGDEVTPGVQWLTLRSDKNDKYAQPDARWLGKPGVPTGIGYDAPALKGAENIVLPGVDHRETAFSPAAFAATWQFLTGQAPRTTDVTPEKGAIELGGRVSGMGLDVHDPASGNFANNLALTGARLSVYAVDAATGVRRGDAVHRQTIGADGRWQFQGQAGTAYEFVVEAPGYATTHVYRSPFPRASSVINLRPERIAPADRNAGSIVVFTRPRGYFDAQRDSMRFDGQSPPPGVPPSGAGVSSSTLKLPAAAPRSIGGTFDGEHVTGRTWPAGAAPDGQLTVLELTC